MRRELMILVALALAGCASEPPTVPVPDEAVSNEVKKRYWDLQERQKEVRR